MDIEQSLIRNESFNDNEIRFFSETAEVVNAIGSLYDQDQVVDDSSNETNEVVDADSNNVYSTNEFFSLEELKALLFGDQDQDVDDSSSNELVVDADTVYSTNEFSSLEELKACLFGEDDDDKMQANSTSFQIPPSTSTFTFTRDLDLEFSCQPEPMKAPQTGDFHDVTNKQSLQNIPPSMTPLPPLPLPPSTFTFAHLPLPPSTFTFAGREIASQQQITLAEIDQFADAAAKQKRKMKMQMQFNPNLQPSHESRFRPRQLNNNHGHVDAHVQFHHIQSCNVLTPSTSTFTGDFASKQIKDIHTANPKQKGKGKRKMTMLQFNPNLQSSQEFRFGPKRPRQLQLHNHGHMDAHVQILHHNFRFLFRKKLTNSDVARSQRIVIPKNEAESNLPALRDEKVMSIPMVDIESLQEWPFQYKIWQNRKNKMCILEKTGEFVRSHDLICGDLIIVYRDDSSRTYGIKGKKQLSHNEDVLENQLNSMQCRVARSIEHMM